MTYMKVSQQNAARSLAARAIQRRWRNRRMGRVVTAAKVAQIARSVNLRQAETKQFQAASYLNMTSDFWQGVNLIYPMTQGTTSVNVIGEKIHLSSFNFRCLYRTDTARTDSIQYLRVALIKAKKDFTNTSASLSTTDLVKSPTAATPFCDMFDYHKISVIRQYKRVLIPKTTKGYATSFDFNVKVGKNEFFQTDNGGYFKNGNYYLIAMATDGTGINTTGQFIYSYDVNFKDE